MHSLDRMYRMDRKERQQHMGDNVVLMGVAGCGKSSVGAALSQALGWPLIEGDDHHSESNRDKMRRGVALTDADREGWLATLARLLAERPQDTLLTCSALKRSYRDRLRVASPGLRFVYLEIDRNAARQRVQDRAGRHFFAASLIDSQFDTLEPPLSEPAVLRVDATAPLPQLVAQIAAWLNAEPAR